MTSQLPPRPNLEQLRTRGPRQMPSVRFIRELSDAVVAAAAQEQGRGKPFPFIFAPPLGPLRRARPTTRSCARRTRRRRGVARTVVGRSSARPSVDT